MPPGETHYLPERFFQVAAGVVEKHIATSAQPFVSSSHRYQKRFPLHLSYMVPLIKASIFIDCIMGKINGCPSTIVLASGED